MRHAKQNHPSGTARNGKSGPRRRTDLAAAVALAAASLLSAAQCFAGKVVTDVQASGVSHGTARFTRTGNVMNVYVSNGAVIDYKSFNLGTEGSIHFIEPRGGRVLNEVTGSAPALIDGSITASGAVYFADPSGITFGPGSHVSAAALYAAGGSISAANFASNVNQFHLTAGVTNQGSLHADIVVLAGQHVTNTGTIVAPKGMVAMAAGGDVLIGPASGGILLKVSPAASLAPPSRQSIYGAGDLYSYAVRNSGAVQASQIALQGAKGSTVNASGSLDASNRAGAGGTVQILGDQVQLTSLHIDASGTTGGGTILVGGNSRGQGPQPNAANTTVSADTSLKVDALTSGPGGKVVVWSNGTTSFAGSISGKGAGSGNGGSAEVSGHTLAYTGTTNLTSPTGHSGQLLLDPYAVEIVAAATGTDDASLQTDFGNIPDTENPAASYQISSAALNLQLATSNVSISALSTITVDSGANITSVSPNSLALVTTGRTLMGSSGGITINAPITTAGGSVTLVSMNGGIAVAAPIVTAGGSVNITASAATSGITTQSISTSGGNVTLRAATGSVFVGTIGVPAAGLTPAAPAGNVTVSSLGFQSTGGITTGSGNVVVSPSGPGDAGISIPGAINTTGGAVAMSSNSAGVAISVGGSIATNGGTVVLSAPSGQVVVSGIGIPAAPTSAAILAGAVSVTSLGFTDNGGIASSAALGAAVTVAPPMPSSADMGIAIGGAIQTGGGSVTLTSNATPAVVASATRISSGATSPNPTNAPVFVYGNIATNGGAVTLTAANGPVAVGGIDASTANTSATTGGVTVAALGFTDTGGIVTTGPTGSVTIMPATAGALDAGITINGAITTAGGPVMLSSNASTNPPPTGATNANSTHATVFVDGGITTNGGNVTINALTGQVIVNGVGSAASPVGIFNVTSLGFTDNTVTVNNVVSGGAIVSNAMTGQAVTIEPQPINAADTGITIAGGITTLGGAVTLVSNATTNATTGANSAANPTNAVIFVDGSITTAGGALTLTAPAGQVAVGEIGTPAPAGAVTVSSLGFTDYGNLATTGATGNVSITPAGGTDAGIIIDKAISTTGGSVTLTSLKATDPAFVSTIGNANSVDAAVLVLGNISTAGGAVTLNAQNGIAFVGKGIGVPGIAGVPQSATGTVAVTSLGFLDYGGIATAVTTSDAVKILPAGPGDAGINIDGAVTSAGGAVTLVSNATSTPLGINMGTGTPAALNISLSLAVKSFNPDYSAIFVQNIATGAKASSSGSGNVTLTANNDRITVNGIDTSGATAGTVTVTSLGFTDNGGITTSGGNIVVAPPTGASDGGIAITGAITTTGNGNNGSLTLTTNDDTQTSINLFQAITTNGGGVNITAPNGGISVSGIFAGTGAVTIESGSALVPDATAYLQNPTATSQQKKFSLSNVTLPEYVTVLNGDITGGTVTIGGTSFQSTIQAELEQAAAHSNGNGNAPGSLQSATIASRSSLEINCQVLIMNAFNKLTVLDQATDTHTSNLTINATDPRTPSQIGDITVDGVALLNFGTTPTHNTDLPLAAANGGGGSPPPPLTSTFPPATVNLNQQVNRPLLNHFSEPSAGAGITAIKITGSHLGDITPGEFGAAVPSHGEKLLKPGFFDGLGIITISNLTDLSASIKSQINNGFIFAVIPPAGDYTGSGFQADIAGSAAAAVPRTAQPVQNISESPDSAQQDQLKEMGIYATNATGSMIGTGHNFALYNDIPLVPRDKFLSGTFRSSADPAYGDYHVTVGRLNARDVSRVLEEYKSLYWNWPTPRRKPDVRPTPQEQAKHDELVKSVLTRAEQDWAASVGPKANGDAPDVDPKAFRQYVIENKRREADANDVLDRLQGLFGDIDQMGLSKIEIETAHQKLLAEITPDVLQDKIGDVVAAGKRGR